MSRRPLLFPRPRARLAASLFGLVLSALLGILPGTSCATPADHNTPWDRLRIGVESGIPPATVEVLTTVLRGALPERTIEATTLPDEDLRRSAGQNDVELLLTSAAFPRRLGLSTLRPVASQAHRYGSDPNRSNGALVLVRAERTDLLNFTSLRAAEIGRSPEWGFDGNEAFFAEAARNGIAPGAFTALRTMPPDVGTALEALSAGTFDAVVLPACRLETYLRTNAFDTSAFRVLAPKTSRDLACAHSTRLYPGLTITATPALQPEEARAVIGALLSAPPDETGAFWGEATDYAALDEALRLLNIDAYADLRKWSLSRLWEDYRPWWIGGFAAIVALILHSLLVSWLVRRRTAALTESLARERAFEEQSRIVQNRIRKLERMGLLGQVGSLVAHEIGQPLSAISLYAYGLRQKARKGTLTPEAIEESTSRIAEQTALAEAVVAKVRGFLRSRARTTVETIDLRTVFEKALAGFTASGKRRSEIRREMEDRPYSIRADALELELIFLNLLRNAEEAQTDVADPYIVVRLEKDASNVALTVFDNGPPVAPERLNELLESMTSTKAEGLGLGLSIVRSLVEAQCGHLSCTQSPTGGVAIRLVWPSLRKSEHA